MLTNDIAAFPVQKPVYPTLISSLARDYEMHLFISDSGVIIFLF